MSKTAILVPLLGREKFTERFLEFNNLIKSKETFYLADGSKNKVFSQTSLQKKYPHIKIIYKNYPFDENFDFYSNKMNKILKEIKEEYIMQIANDDFYNYKFVEKAQKFLSKNKSYSLVGGKIQNVRIIYLFKNVNDYGKLYFQKKDQYYQYGKIYESIDEKDKNKRVFQFLQTLPYECLIRKKTVLKIWKLSKEFKIKNSMEMNWFYNIIPLIFGKKKFFNMYSQIRQCNTHESLGLSDLYEKGGSRKRFYDFLKLMKNKNLIKKKLVLEKLKRVDDMDIDVFNLNRNLYFKKIWFPVYVVFKRSILLLNSIVFGIFFIFEK